MLKSQDMLPDVDAGIFLDNDMLVLQDPALLWDEFKLFTPFTAMAVAPVEAHYSREMVSSEQNNRRGKCICKISSTSHFEKRIVEDCVGFAHIASSSETTRSLFWHSWTWSQRWCCSHEPDKVLFIFLHTNMKLTILLVPAVETPRNCTISSMLKLLQDFLEFLAKVFNGSNIKYLLTVLSLD